METFEIKGPYIELNKLMKVMGWAETGGHAKLLIQEESVLRNQARETRIRAKLVAGDVIDFEGMQVKLVATSE